MISSKDREIVINCAKKYRIKSIILFGSSLIEETPNDIDLGIEGIAKDKFFPFYDEIFRKRSLPIDLVDLTKKSLFNDLIERRKGYLWVVCLKKLELKLKI